VLSLSSLVGLAFFVVAASCRCVLPFALQIFYVTGDSKDSAARSPVLERLKRLGLEVSSGTTSTRLVRPYLGSYLHERCTATAR